MATEDNHPFWQFSIDVYARDGVADACIALQESCGIDVNILLFCCWAGAVGSPVLSSDQIEAAHAVVADWNRDVVQGLRAVRNRLKAGVSGFDADDVEALRQRVLGIEINAEHKEQLRLAETVEVAEVPGRAAGERLAACVANISAYFALAAKGDAPPTALATILQNVFPESPKSDIAAALAAL